MWYVVHETDGGSLVNPYRDVAEGDECLDHDVKAGCDVDCSEGTGDEDKNNGKQVFVVVDPV